MTVTVVGAGLAGSEAAWQIAKRGVPVELLEMRDQVQTKAHKTALPAELVCSNSFRGRALHNAVGLLKAELQLCGSLIMEAALHAEVPAGGALAVDRDLFSQFISEKLSDHPLITIVRREVDEVPSSSKEHPVIIATGPLTSSSLASKIEALVGSDTLAFFDAISPILFGESLDMTQVFRQSRYNLGNGDDYLNIPLSKEEYLTFVQSVLDAEKYTGNEDVESDSLDKLRPFEGCMPIEDMAERGIDTLRFGPLKPKGLVDPRTGEQPYAVIQLRQDDMKGSLWSMVGLQTRMKRHEQETILRSLPGLQNADFVRYGSVHRNTFIQSPLCLERSLLFKKGDRSGLFFAGQITGVEGYVESTAGGLLAGINAARLAQGKGLLSLPENTASGALLHYISEESRKDFQPMNVSFGLFPCYESIPRRNEKGKKIGKRELRERLAEKALGELRDFLEAAGESL